MQYPVQFDYTGLRIESESILNQLAMGSTAASMHEIRASTPERVADPMHPFSHVFYLKKFQQLQSTAEL